MMTSTQIRKSFLDFFKSKQHTIVPSSSLMPDSPNLLFTNAGMNQFVPIFLGQTQCPYTPGRAADTQKCIRAGGKHNDLDDVGLDTYHHTFFEMLGNWSFGDYFKKEAIDWAWELVVNIWKFPPSRLYATVYSPDKTKNDPSEFDQDAWDFWAEKFRTAGLNPQIHIVNGNKKDNFWMMGETGPCGPCSELHVDLTPDGDTKGSLVNQGDARCIEIWNLVFIQFNANPDGTFSPLPAQHVDTGMGFERVTSIIQGTKNFTDFANAKISNYETDIFRPIFDALEKLSGKKYHSTLPVGQASRLSQTSEKNSGDKDGDRRDACPTPEQIQIDVAFRVIADHIRTLSFAIADGIQPGNNDRNYVLRRILRRAVRYGRTLGFHEPFFYKLVDVVAENFGDIFPEIRAKKKHVQDVIRIEEEAFNKTLDRGIELFKEEASLVFDRINSKFVAQGLGVQRKLPREKDLKLSGDFAFKLYDTYGFPVDLTLLMARELDLDVDQQRFEQLMDDQRARARAAQKKSIITVADRILEQSPATKFVGYEKLDFVSEVQHLDFGKKFIATTESPFYAEMGGQVSDTGKIELSDSNKLVTTFNITGVKRLANGVLVHQFSNEVDFDKITETYVYLVVDSLRRNAIQRHHTVTHLLHWALHEVTSQDATQKGSFVGPDKLTFDFNSPPLTPQQIADIEKLVNEKILENAGVSWTEVAHADVKNRKDVMQFFGDKYGDTVRVVQIGGDAKKLNGYSMELCGGTHVRATGEIGLFRIVSEAAVAAGVRRIEAVAGLEAYQRANDELHLIKMLAGKINSPVHELAKKIENLLAHQKELEKSLRTAQQKTAGGIAKELLAKAETVNGIPSIIKNLADADGDTLQTIADALKSEFKGVTVLGGVANHSVALVASVSPEFTAKISAGKIIQTIAPMVGGKGGGKPDHARGGGKDAAKLDEALAKVKSLFES